MTGSRGQIGANRMRSRGPRRNPGDCGIPAAGFLLCLVLAACAAVLLPRASWARSPAVSVAGGDSLGLWVLIDWPEPLPAFVQDRLRRGIPATVGYRCELWKDRPGWFDSHLASTGAEFKVLFDPWSGSFTLLDGGTAVSVDSLGSLLDFFSRRRARVSLDPGWCDGESRYRVIVNTYVRPLTAKDVREVDAWLRGELRGFSQGLFGIPRGLFGIVRDLSGLGERTSRGESPVFYLNEVDEGRVRVLILAEGAAGSDRPTGLEGPAGPAGSP